MVSFPAVPKGTTERCVSVCELCVAVCEVNYLSSAKQEYGAGKIVYFCFVCLLFALSALRKQ